VLLVLARAHALGELEERSQLLAREVGDREKVAVLGLGHGSSVGVLARERSGS
jgi:hypothetical protein